MKKGITVFRDCVDQITCQSGPMSMINSCEKSIRTAMTSRRILATLSDTCLSLLIEGLDQLSIILARFGRSCSPMEKNQSAKIFIVNFHSEVKQIEHKILDRKINIELEHHPIDTEKKRREK